MEFLIFRLTNKQSIWHTNNVMHNAAQNNEHTVDWLVWSATQNQVLHQGSIVNLSHLSELIPYAQQRQVIVLLAAYDVMLTKVAMPHGSANNFNLMLPYLLEDEVAQDIEQLHFAVLDKVVDPISNAKIAYVCALDKTIIQNIVSIFTQHNINVNRIMPDSLTLPLVQNEQVKEYIANDEKIHHISLTIIGEHYLIRALKHHGMLIESYLLDAYFQQYLIDSNTKLHIHYYKLATENLVLDELLRNVIAQQERLELYEQNSASLLELLAPEAVQAKINLLIGSFKPKSNFVQKYWNTWKYTAIASLMFIIVSAGYNILMLERYKEQTMQYTQETERIFRQIFPDKQKIPTVSYLRREMTNEIKLLSVSNDQENLLRQLEILAPLLEQIATLQIVDLKYDLAKNEIRLQAISSDFQVFDQAKDLLANDFTVEQGQLNRVEQTVSGSFVLKLQ